MNGWRRTVGGAVLASAAGMRCPPVNQSGNQSGSQWDFASASLSSRISFSRELRASSPSSSRLPFPPLFLWTKHTDRAKVFSPSSLPLSLSSFSRLRRRFFVNKSLGSVLNFEDTGRTQDGREEREKKSPRQRERETLCSVEKRREEMRRASSSLGPLSRLRLASREKSKNFSQETLPLFSFSLSSFFPSFSHSVPRSLGLLSN